LSKFVPYKKEKDSITIRLPSELLQAIDQKAGAIDISRNELITQCIEYALRNMDTNE